MSTSAMMASATASQNLSGCYRAEQARRRVTDAIEKQLDPDNNEKLIIRLDRFASTLSSLFFRTRHSIALPTVNFHILMSKWSFAVYVFFRFLAQCALVTFLAVGLGAIVSSLNGQPIDIQSLLQTAISSPAYLTVVLLIAFINGRSVLFRFDDKEVS